MLVLALLQATGIAELVRRHACEIECRDDGCGNDCTSGNDAPSCPCHCPSVQSQTPPAIASVTMPPPTEAAPVVFDNADRMHGSPDPADILHIPKHVV
ncbi:MAG TPA: hypothetical protein VFV99_13380 [Kofleriaceae bacterium]|nr:hypothetical protein [Kofleriaceae bacterium]